MCNIAENVDKHCINPIKVVKIPLGTSRTKVLCKTQKITQNYTHIHKYVCTYVHKDNIISMHNKVKGHTYIHKHAYQSVDIIIKLYT